VESSSMLSSPIHLVSHPLWVVNSSDTFLTVRGADGVRAGAKRLGRKKERERSVHREHAPRPDDQPYVPPTRPYELSTLVLDLVVLARYMLKPGGRLVFFLPTVTDEYKEIDIDAMICEGMEIIANSLQEFGSWGRRLITIRKTTSIKFSPPTFDYVGETDLELSQSHVPAHKDFREKYFQGFRKDTEEAS